MEFLEEQDNSIVISVKFCGAIFEGIVEILGLKGTRDLLQKANVPFKINNFYQVDIKDGFTKNQIILLSKTLEKEYGASSGNGILWKIGRSTLHYLIKNFGNIQIVGSLEQRMMPFQQKIHSGLEVLAELLMKQAEGNVLVQEKEKKHWDFSIESDWMCISGCKVRWCFFIRGLLIEFLEWLDSRRSYAVEESECTAKGNSSCVFKIVASAIE